MYVNGIILHLALKFIFKLEMQICSLKDKVGLEALLHKPAIPSFPLLPTKRKSPQSQLFSAPETNYLVCISVFLHNILIRLLFYFPVFAVIFWFPTLEGDSHTCHRHTPTLLVFLSSQLVIIFIRSLFSIYIIVTM